MPDRAKSRCAWVGDDPLNVAYHDHEWGCPTRDERRLFEALTLEGAQAGLSWLTILRKRDGYRRAFAEFDPERVATFGPPDVDRLLGDASIVRHRGKIESTINNARCILALRESGPGFADFVWEAVGGKTRVNHWESSGRLPARTRQSEALSQRLRQAGFRFVGPTTAYAFMQAAGLVNDHETGCFRHPVSTGE